MDQIKCPKCGEVFTVSEDGYAKLVQQVRNEEFAKELKKRAAEAQKLAEAQRKADVAESAQEIASFKAKVKELQSQLAAQIEKGESDRKLAAQQEAQKATEERSALKAQIKELEVKLASQVDKSKIDCELAAQQEAQKALEEHAALKAQVEKLEVELKTQVDAARAEKELAVRDALEGAQKEATELKLAQSQEKNELQGQINDLKQQLASEKEIAQSRQGLAVKEALEKAAEETAKLKDDLAQAKANFSAAIENAKMERELAVVQAQSQAKEELRRVEDERNELSGKIQTMEARAAELANAHKLALAEKDAEIDRVRSDKAKLSTKMLGESLEQHCEIAFNQVRSYAFPRAQFGKDNDASLGTKGDYIYREVDEDGIEVLSIMFEMKNEAEDSTHTKKNSDHFKKLDKDRNDKKCEYAVLVSLLEPESDLYNGGIVDVSYEYPKMFVVRPQFFIPLIGLLRNAALDALAYKQEVALMRRQNIDVTNFEEKLEKFKAGFSHNFELASKQFGKAIDEIDASIAHLQKVRDNLLKSERNLEIANKKVDDVTVRKLTFKNPTMREAFKEARKAKEEALESVEGADPDLAEGEELVEAEIVED